jgi:hypothetical protein
VRPVSRSVAAVAADRSLDPAGSRSWRAQDEREVATLDPPLANRVREPRVRLVGAGDDQQAGGIAVEPVDDPRPLGIPTGGAEGEQAVRQGRSLGGAGGMGDEAGGLVDDEQVLVLVGDVERELDRDERPRDRELDVDVLAPCEPMALRARLSIHQDVPGGHQPLCERTGPHFRELGDERVQPAARVGLRNAKAVRCQRRRSSGRPPRTRGTGARRRRR